MSYPQDWYPDAELLAERIRASQTGDSQALERLLGSLRPSFLAYFSRRLSADVAEDFTQIALIRIARAVDRIDPERANAYVTTVLRNLLRTARSRQLRDEHRYLAIDNLVADARQDVGTRTEYEEMARVVHRITTTALPAPLADIVLGLLRGESPSEIATRQGISPITVRTRLLRARAILRREFREEFAEGHSPHTSVDTRNDSTRGSR